MSGTAFRAVAFVVGIVLLCLGTLPFRATDQISDPGLLRVFGFFLMAAGLGLARGFFPITDKWGRKGAVFMLLLSVFILPRLLLWPAAESDDSHRYRWEGRLVLAGENPFAMTADAPEREVYRDTDWEQMNHRDKGTVYPPLAQLIFAGIVAVDEKLPEVRVEKVFFLFCDFGTFLVVLLLLRRRQLPPSFSLFFAINPVVLVAFAGEAHYDSLFVLPLVAAVWALETGHRRLSWLLLAFSVQIKLISLILLPFWMLRGGWRNTWIFALVVILSWIPFAEAIPDWISSLLAFGGESTFFGLIPFMMRVIGVGEEGAAVLGIVLFLAFSGWILRAGGSAGTVARRFFGAALISSPILHFWYLAWIVPFLALRPGLAWFWLCAGQGFYFLVWDQQAAVGRWGLPMWAEAVVWIPFILLGLCEGWRLVRRPKAKDDARDSSVGIVIPTFNAEACLSSCVESIRESERAPVEIVVVDGGSADRTVDLAEEMGVRVEKAPLGRGSQILRGVEVLQSEWVLVLHADCTLHPLAIGAIRAMDAVVAGGACGQRFNDAGPVLSVVEFMNEGRAVHGESYWGDQGQFFRRRWKRVWEDLADFPLMEDVELSRRLRRIGETRYLGLETRADTAKWKEGGRARRFLLVFRAVIRFRLACLIGCGKKAAGRLYEEYYSSG